MTRAQQRFQPIFSHPIRAAILATRGEGTCLLVGGTIRDLLIFDRLGGDWDLVVSEAASFATRLAGHLGARLVRLGGSGRALYRVVLPEMQIDLQEPLVDSLEGELRRRDLTVNSIALDLDAGTLYDPMTGYDDISLRLLRANSSTTFTADPLRVVRLLRFAVTLPNFEVEDRTAELARSARDALQNVSSERIRDELHKALSAPRVPRLSSVLSRLGLLPTLWGPYPAETESGPLAIGSLDDLDVIVNEVELETGMPIEPIDREALRHAALLSLIGDDPEPGAAARRLLKRGLVTKRLAGHIERLAQPAIPPHDEPTRRRLIHLWGRSWAAALALQWWRAPSDDRDGWPQAAIAMNRTVTRVGGTLFEPQALLTGHQLRDELGLSPGKEMGRVITALKEAQIVGTISTPEEARRWLRLRGFDRGGSEKGG